MSICLPTSFNDSCYPSVPLVEYRLPFLPVFESIAFFGTVSIFLTASLALWFRKHRLRYLLRISTFLFFTVSVLDLLCQLQEKACLGECSCHKTAYHRLLLYYVSGIFLIVMLIVRYHWGRPFNIVKSQLSVGFSHLKEEARARRKGVRHVAGERMAQGDPGHVPPVYPNGWIPLIESKEVGQGQAVSVTALGQRFCVFRGEGGQAYVLDAYCPHLGADMSAGGKVAGECIECPFHGWQFSGRDGTCQNIPYSCKGKNILRMNI
ncbi:3-ketosteroid-9-alpha-hydroxylase oxygenase subunit [Nephila pilipes]|uniref:3-ketosteroid-9-alpha-hydroxylase oxygenase subunit n=1 Tax=Nephila pilipes TaxID=299642 RepID=A0A8X6N785_NEPPI|nr:3-ketosteroid-9-alpha-hydroxylase oxygenase subunit [Nephila pilipes]